MFRIELSPDRPMFVQMKSKRNGSGAPEAVICAGREIPQNLLLLLLSDQTVLFEPDPAKAISHCLEGDVSRLLVDLARLDSAALSALVQLRLLRPAVEMILLDRGEESHCLEGTILQGLPVVRERKRRAFVARGNAPGRRRGL